MSLFVYAIGSIIYSLAYILPVFPLPFLATLNTGLEAMISAGATVNFFFPIYQLFSAFSFLISFEIALYLVSLITKIIGFFRGKSIDI